MALFALSIPFEGVGGWSVHDVLGLRLCDLVMFASVPLLLPLLWRVRRSVGESRVVRACAALALAASASVLLTDAGGSLFKELARAWAPVTVIASLVAVAASGRLGSVVTAARLGGLIALAVSLLGYAIAVFIIEPVSPAFDVFPFVYSSKHPFFDGWPRLSGTFGHVAQGLGEYALVWIALLHYPTAETEGGMKRFPRVAGTTLAALAVMLTFSSAWIGLPLVLAGTIPTVSGRLKRWVLVCSITATIGLTVATTWAMNFGIPDPRASERQRLVAPCESSDIMHNVSRFDAENPSTCRRFARTRPYPFVLTQYLLAKETAVSAFLAHPWIGVGPGQYPRFSRDYFSRRYGNGSSDGIYYETPHSTYLGIAATGGMLGIFSFAFLLATLWKLRHQQFSEARTTWLVLAALLLIGINIDVLHQRYLWLLLGLIGAKESSDGPPDSRKTAVPGRNSNGLHMMHR